jgi:hypothetical protein
VAWLGGVILATSDAHEGIKASFSKIMNCTSQRCRSKRGPEHTFQRLI